MQVRGLRELAGREVFFGEGEAVTWGFKQTCRSKMVANSLRPVEFDVELHKFQA